MLAVEPLRGAPNGDDRDGARGSFDDFADEGLLEDINFGDLFMGFDDDGDVLPDLELDPAEIFADFSVGAGEDVVSGASTDEGGGIGTVVGAAQDAAAAEGERREEEEEEEEEEKEASSHCETPAQVMSDKGRKPPAATAPAKGSSSQGKRKAKVDWTPELHRRFVQAVEQLGIDKAVPSRILELMGIDCLTRHNIASHLQKYRSHRKHLLAREAEAASWSQRRQVYAAASTGPAGVPPKRPEISPWLAPTIGFPPPPPPPVPQAHQGFRPLHVWGHPTGEAPPVVHMWLRQLAPRVPVPWAAPPTPPAADPSSYWQQQHYPRGIPHAMTQGTPCFAQPLPAAAGMQRFPAAAAAAQVPGIVPHHPMYRAVPPPTSKHASSQLQLDAHPVSAY
ncbi:hypothetical protein Cni_G18086 [Canna indica]|uniref:HTH myb-type domain-containing protein n=1 Tax=Canna indica TaxID=4628 RepID=A0AAQ3KI75_9LILI|nr:hypothetical protein Cni_G18086 [Canna indica]